MISDFLGFLILLMRTAPIKTFKNRILAQGRLCTGWCVPGSEWAVHLGGLPGLGFPRAGAELHLGSHRPGRQKHDDG